MKALFVGVLLFTALLPGAFYIIPKPSTPSLPYSVVMESNGQFVGATTGDGSQFVGYLNGTVAKATPDGRILTSTALPDRNSAAHLLFLNGSLYVGSEKLPGARDAEPYHVYRLDASTLQVLASMRFPKGSADGLVMYLNGTLWAASGHCNLYSLDPKTLSIRSMIPSVAEDELLFDGSNYWGECINMVYVFQGNHTIATGQLSFPDRPRGFFMQDGTIYATRTSDNSLFRMQVYGSQVAFTKVASLGGTPTKDTFDGWAYLTDDNHPVRASIAHYGPGFSLESLTLLPGYALPTDASQHSMFSFQGKLWFVTDSTMGFLWTSRDPWTFTNSYGDRCETFLNGTTVCRGGGP
ncbi:MAG: hypothetical protein KGI38_11750 [Thaumarchaeota archaeon]|nr:hypothetical protein [Nitrososphaerota archaeon]